jgi:hypothetical protein
MEMSEDISRLSVQKLANLFQSLGYDSGDMDDIESFAEFGISEDKMEKVLSEVEARENYDPEMYPQDIERDELDYPWNSRS